MLRLTLTCR